VAAASGAVVVTHGGHADAVPTSADVPLDDDDELSTAPDARARMVVDSGATVELVADTRVRVRAARGERIAISVGEIAVHVPKLGANESFRVETPDAEVTVHGTSFVVSVHDGKTRVTVSDGVVTVKDGAGESTLRAGDAWPAPPPPPPPSAAPAPSAAPPRVRPDPSTLDDQNRLLQRALASRRQGDDARALVDLDALLVRYPGSPLAQEARVEKFRALERMGQHARAVGEARRYLADYPNGFAADEARALALR
jgi:ferric-dicitrate binding protein FerR (iron transport regulator)